MKKIFLHILFFFLLCFLTSIQPIYAQDVTNNGLALRLDNGLTATLQGAFVNKTNGADLGTFDNAGTVTLTGDWENNSANTVFSTNTGLVKFLGSAAQRIKGTNTTGFFDFTEDNSFASTALTLDISISVRNQLTLTQGHIVTDATKLITLSSVALTPIGGSNTSFIKGPMVHSKSSVGMETKVYPVGKGAFMHKIELNVNHSDAVATTYTGEYLAASAIALGWALPVSLKHVSNNGYWDITKGGAATVVNDASAKLYYIASDDADVAADLRVARGTASPWVDEGGTGTANNVGSITSTVAFSSFGRFSLSNIIGGMSPLPIELLSFYAKPNGTTVDLIWATASEINNDFFTLERTMDGVNFEVIGIVKGGGNTTSVLNYVSVDTIPYDGVSYYRLKQTDFNGNYTYSDLKMVSFEKDVDFSFNIYPNPNDGEAFNLQIIANKNEEVLVVVHNLLGKELYSKVIITSENGNVVHAIDPSEKLPAGVYVITATSNDNIYNKRLIVN